MHSISGGKNVTKYIEVLMITLAHYTTTMYMHFKIFAPLTLTSLYLKIQNPVKSRKWSD